VLRLTIAVRIGIISYATSPEDLWLSISQSLQGRTGQDIAEYAVMLRRHLVLVIGTRVPDWRKRQQRVLQRCQFYSVVLVSQI
jgi:hypothetical protein